MPLIEASKIIEFETGLTSEQFLDITLYYVQKKLEHFQINKGKHYLFPLTQDINITAQYRLTAHLVRGVPNA